jgi:simple sugar transport system ATP-binding protein
LAILELNAVSKHFGAIHALNEVDMALEAGEVLGLMGDNGAGKSTLVKVIAGNFPPTHGEIRLGGEPVHFHKPVEAREKGVEVVYQDLALCNNLSAAANVFLGREIKRRFGPLRWLDHKAMAKRAGELFGELKSETRPRDLVRQMSGGQRQAVAIILISHRMPDVFAVCDRVMVMRRGNKVADKPIKATSPEEVTGLITGAIHTA